MTTPPKRMHAPSHPGEILREDVIPALKLTSQEAAVQLNVPVDDLVHVLNADAPVTAEFAARIEAWLGVDHGGNAEFWLAMQAQYDLWHARKLDLSGVQRAPEEVREDSPTSVETIRTRSGRTIVLNTPEEDAEIQRGIDADPDNPEWTTDDFTRAQPFPKMLAERRYAYVVRWIEEDRQFVGLCPSLPSLSWLEKTPEAALEGIRRVVSETVQEMLGDKEPLPEAVHI